MGLAMPNAYSQTWFDLFLREIPRQQTQTEAEFLRRQLPNPALVRVLDVCCGEARHAIALARYGYDVTGIDTNPEALKRARASAGETPVKLLPCDMRELSSLGTERFDALTCLWQSFGYFDAQTNQRVMQSFADLLIASGRLILDVYNADFFRQHQGTRSFHKCGKLITETKWMEADRLHVTLEYADESVKDEFDWQVFTPDELQRLGETCGLRMLLSCSEFAEVFQPSAQRPRMQMIFEQLNL